MLGTEITWTTTTTKTNIHDDNNDDDDNNNNDNNDEDDDNDNDNDDIDDDNTDDNDDKSTTATTTKLRTTKVQGIKHKTNAVKSNKANTYKSRARLTGLE